MAFKRKIDCSLDDIVKEYLKKVKCKKSSKMFGAETSSESDLSKSLKKFMKFLKENETNKGKSVEDDLGFEINFGAFQPEPKVSFCLNQDFPVSFTLFHDFEDTNFILATC